MTIIQQSSPCQRACCLPRQEVWKVEKVSSFFPPAFFQILKKKHFQGTLNMFWSFHLSDASQEKGVGKAGKLVKQQQTHADQPIQRETIKHVEISGPAVTLLTSHLFEPEQLRGLHLWWHDPSHPAQDPVAGVCYTSGLLFSSMVHPHHHVPLSVTW